MSNHEWQDIQVYSQLQRIVDVAKSRQDRWLNLSPTENLPAAPPSARGEEHVHRTRGRGNIE